MPVEVVLDVVDSLPLTVLIIACYAQIIPNCSLLLRSRELLRSWEHGSVCRTCIRVWLIQEKETDCGYATGHVPPW